MMNNANGRQPGAGPAAPLRHNGTQRPAAPKQGTRQASGRAATPRRNQGAAAADRRYSLLKKALLLGLIVYAWLVIGTNSARDVDFQVIASAMASAPGVEYLDVCDANAFQDRFATVPDGCDGWLLYGSLDHMDVTEAMVAKAADESALDRLEDAARARIDAQLTSFRGYGVDQTELLEHAVLLRRGKYLFYCVSENADRWEDTFLSCIR